MASTIKVDNILKEDGSSHGFLKEGQGGAITNAFQKSFNTHHSYTGNGVHMSCYDWTISGLTPGNKLYLHYYMFGESHHDCNLRLMRDSDWQLQGTGGGQTAHPAGIYTPKYDQNESSTPNLGSFQLVVDITSTSHVLKLYRYGTSGTWFVNRCYTVSYEVGATTLIAYEVKP